MKKLPLPARTYSEMLNKCSEGMMQINVRNNFITHFPTFLQKEQQYRILSSTGQLFTYDRTHPLEPTTLVVGNLTKVKLEKLPGRYRGWLSQRVLEWKGRRGIASNYKRRVMRADVDAMTTACGFRVIDSFYSNLAPFKGLFKTIPTTQREEFSQFWAETEKTLNARFIVESSEKYGDKSNLWQFMGSRTLVLQRRTG